MHETSVKNRLQDISGELEQLIGEAEKAAPAASGEIFPDWQRACRTCRDRLEDDLLRMAVVGTIKSGKSTFINSLFSGDHLKRGAGVITSIVTKVRASDSRRAFLYFKSWGEINGEIDRSLRIFFAAGVKTRKAPVDIRNPEDRRWLEEALQGLESRYLLSNDTRNMDHVLLGSYLRGYSKVKEVISDGNRVLCFENEQFFLHQEYAGSEDLSVFLKDIRLEIDSEALEPNIEIADCQGSDSPNPLHLAMIQDYLQTADLVVYIVSSRTGLRQADIRFLRMIKSMVGMHHVLFVVNCDFNEHASIEDLERVAGKVREELALMVSEPSVYVFSALFSLFSAARPSLSEKDRIRMEQWETDTPLASYSQAEEKRFFTDFRKMITVQRFSILLKSQVHCLNAVASDLEKWLRMSSEVLSTDSPGAAGVLEKIEKQQQQTDQLHNTVQAAMDGAAAQLKKSIKSDADRFFDTRGGTLVPGIIEFVRGYAVAYEQYRHLLEEGDFSSALFAVFQMFKQDLDRYMAETVNPLLIGFVRQKEDEISAHFESLAGPYRTMILHANGEFGAIHNGGAFQTGGDEPVVDLASIKKNHGLSFPSAAATLDYSGTLKTEAFMKLGFYRFTGVLNRLIRRSRSPENRDVAALRAGVSRMKKETEASLDFYFKNYRENIKFQYFFKLIESVAGEMLLQLVHRYSGYQEDLLALKRAADETHDEKALKISAIHDTRARLRKIAGKLEGIENEL